MKSKSNEERTIVRANATDPAISESQRGLNPPKFSAAGERNSLQLMKDPKEINKTQTGLMDCFPTSIKKDSEKEN